MPQRDRNRRPHLATSPTSSGSWSSSHFRYPYEGCPHETQSTDPTSLSSDPFNLVRNDKPDSDLEAQYGSSQGIRPETSSEASLGSAVSRENISGPNTFEKIKGIGGPLTIPESPVEATELQPNTDHEARIILDSVDRARSTNSAADAFQSHLKHAVSVPELSIQRQMIMSDADVKWVTMRSRGQKRAVAAVDHSSMLDIEGQRNDESGASLPMKSMVVIIALLAVLAMLCRILCSDKSETENNLSYSPT
ncbi:hypothetical protein ACLMJK_003565 [Lecanora helva]